LVFAVSIQYCFFLAVASGERERERERKKKTTTMIYT